jgi:hypothetical protein
VSITVTVSELAVRMNGVNQPQPVDDNQKFWANLRGGTPVENVIQSVNAPKDCEAAVNISLMCV